MINVVRTWYVVTFSLISSEERVVDTNKLAILVPDAKQMGAVDIYA